MHIVQELSDSTAMMNSFITFIFFRASRLHYGLASGTPFAAGLALHFIEVTIALRALER